LRLIPDAPYEEAHGGSASRLSEDDQEVIFSLARIGWSNVKLAERFGISTKIVKTALQNHGFVRQNGRPSKKGGLR
jgi:hypothetical protein